MLSILMVPSIFNVAYAQDNSADILTRLAEDIRLSNEFVDLDSSENVNLEQLAQTSSRLAVRFHESSEYYRSINTSDSLNLSKIAEELGDIMDNVTLSISENDATTYSDTIDSYNSAMDRYNAAIASYQSSSGIVDYSGVIGISVIVTILTSSILLIQSFVGNKLFRAEQIRNKYQFDLFKSSLFPLAGSVATYVWLIATPPGGTYYVFWGPIALGYLAFIVSLYRYMTDTRPKIKVMKKRELAKLQSLMKD